MLKDWLYHLMSRHLPRNVRFKPEELICFQFAEEMRRHTITGNYSGIWFHVASEGKRGHVTNLMLIAVGMIPGIPDYVFIGPWGSAVIEFKTPKRIRFNKAMKKTHVSAGKQTLEQTYFQAWCLSYGIPYYICHTAEDGIATLRKLGALK